MQARGFAGNRRKTPIIALAAVLAAAACDSDGTAPVTSRVQVLLTDAPHEELDSALVWISRVYLQGGGGLEPDTAEADTTSVTVDFDVDQDFVIQRNPQTGAVKKILFTPVLREKSREGSGP